MGRSPRSPASMATRGSPSSSTRAGTRRPRRSSARAAERGEPPFVLVLDSLEDPQNVGTLLRSAEAAGVHGVIFPTRRQAPLTPAAVKASAGAVEHLLLCPVDDLPGALTDLHARGIRIAGSEADAPLTARQTDLRGPLAIVVGSEGQGLGPNVRRRCDLLMRIPMRGAVDSLNAAVAGSILLFEAVAQRDPDGRSRPRDDRRPRPAPSASEEASAVPADRSTNLDVETGEGDIKAAAPEASHPEPGMDDATTGPAEPAPAGLEAGSIDDVGPGLVDDLLPDGPPPEAPPAPPKTPRPRKPRAARTPPVEG